MKKFLSRRAVLRSSLALALLLAVGSSLTPTRTHAQSGQLTAIPSRLFRFLVSGSNLGYMLTGIPERGSNLGYVNEGSVAAPFDPSGIVLPPAANYTPAPGEPLVPLYQWRVVEGRRTYYYYSTIIHAVGSNYYFEGLVGYVLPASYDAQTSSRRLTNVAINYYYSQRYGLWYTTQRPEFGNGRFPDVAPGFSPSSTTFRFQGVGFKLPIWDDGPFCHPSTNTCPPVFVFDPPPPPPTCDPYEEQYCFDSGGWWDNNSCTCNYSGRDLNLPPRN